MQKKAIKAGEGLNPIHKEVTPERARLFLRSKGTAII